MHAQPVDDRLEEEGHGDVDELGGNEASGADRHAGPEAGLVTRPQMGQHEG